LELLHVALKLAGEVKYWEVSAPFIFTSTVGLATAHTVTESETAAPTSLTQVTVNVELELIV
jgi:hypothetical protein